jgi:hypothetical protein
LPDYVNWGKKTKVGCIFLRSGVNIVPTISRTLAIYEIDPPTFQEGAASGQSTPARLPGNGWLRAKYIGETGILPALIQKGFCLQNLSEYFRFLRSIAAGKITSKKHNGAVLRRATVC